MPQCSKRIALQDPIAVLGVQMRKALQALKTCVPTENPRRIKYGREHLDAGPEFQAFTDCGVLDLAW